jgi:hypothetical protein
MIRTIAGALGAIKRAETYDQLNLLAASLAMVAWNDGGAIQRAIEDKRSELVREAPSGHLGSSGKA